MCVCVFVKLLTTLGTLEVPCVDHVSIMVILSELIVACDITFLSLATPGDVDRARQARIESVSGECNY